MNENINVEEISMRKKCRAACTVLRRAARNEVLEIPEGKLLFAVIERAVMDLCEHDELNKRTARHYLEGTSLHHFGLLGIDSEYASSVIKKIT